jgi:hypothetical protein
MVGVRRFKGGDLTSRSSGDARVRMNSSLGNSGKSHWVGVSSGLGGGTGQVGMRMQGS